MTIWLVESIDCIRYWTISVTANHWLITTSQNYLKMTFGLDLVSSWIIWNLLSHLDSSLSITNSRLEKLSTEGTFHREALCSLHLTTAFTWLEWYYFILSLWSHISTISISNTIKTDDNVQALSTFKMHGFCWSVRHLRTWPQHRPSPSPSAPCTSPISVTLTLAFFHVSASQCHR